MEEGRGNQELLEVDLGRGGAISELERPQGEDVGADGPLGFLCSPRPDGGRVRLAQLGVVAVHPPQVVPPGGL